MPMYGTLSVLSRKTGNVDNRQYPIEKLTVTLGRNLLTSDIRLHKREIRQLHLKIYVQQKNPENNHDGYRFNLRAYGPVTVNGQLIPKDQDYFLSEDDVIAVPNVDTMLRLNILDPHQLSRETIQLNNDVTLELSKTTKKKSRIRTSTFPNIYKSSASKQPMPLNTTGKRLSNAGRRRSRSSLVPLPENLTAVNDGEETTTGAAFVTAINETAMRPGETHTSETTFSTSNAFVTAIDATMLRSAPEETSTVDGTLKEASSESEQNDTVVVVPKLPTALIDIVEVSENSEVSIDVPAQPTAEETIPTDKDPLPAAADGSIDIYESSEDEITSESEPNEAIPQYYPSMSVSAVPSNLSESVESVVDFLVDSVSETPPTVAANVEEGSIMETEHESAPEVTPEDESAVASESEPKDAIPQSDTSMSTSPVPSDLSISVENVSCDTSIVHTDYADLWSEDDDSKDTLLAVSTSLTTEEERPSTIVVPTGNVTAIPSTPSPTTIISTPIVSMPPTSTPQGSLLKSALRMANSAKISKSVKFNAMSEQKVLTKDKRIMDGGFVPTKLFDGEKADSDSDMDISDDLLPPDDLIDSPVTVWIPKKSPTPKKTTTMATATEKNQSTTDGVVMSKSPIPLRVPLKMYTRSPITTPQVVEKKMEITPRHRQTVVVATKSSATKSPSRLPVMAIKSKTPVVVRPAVVSQSSDATPQAPNTPKPILSNSSTLKTPTSRPRANFIPTGNTIPRDGVPSTGISPSAAFSSPALSNLRDSSSPRSPSFIVIPKSDSPATSLLVDKPTEKVNEQVPEIETEEGPVTTEEMDTLESPTKKRKLSETPTSKATVSHSANTPLADFVTNIDFAIKKMIQPTTPKADYNRHVDMGLRNLMEHQTPKADYDANVDMGIKRMVDPSTPKANYDANVDMGLRKIFEHQSPKADYDSNVDMGIKLMVDPSTPKADYNRHVDLGLRKLLEHESPKADYDTHVDMGLRNLLEHESPKADYDTHVDMGLRNLLEHESPKADYDTHVDMGLRNLLEHESPKADYDAHVDMGLRNLLEESQSTPVMPPPQPPTQAKSTAKRVRGKATTVSEDINAAKEETPILETPAKRTRSIRLATSAVAASSSAVNEGTATKRGRGRTADIASTSTATAEREKPSTAKKARGSRLDAPVVEDEKEETPLLAPQPKKRGRKAAVAPVVKPEEAVPTAGKKAPAKRGRKPVAPIVEPNVVQVEEQEEEKPAAAKGRGRPRKKAAPVQEESEPEVVKPKRGGRRKVDLEDEIGDIAGFNETESTKKKKADKVKMDKLMTKNAAKAGASISAMEAGPSGRKATSASGSGRGRTGGRSAAIAKEQCERIAEVDDAEHIVDVLEDASIAVSTTSKAKRTTRRIAASTKTTTISKQAKAKAPATRKATRRKAAPIVEEEDSDVSENEENSARLANGTVQAEAASSSEDSNDASLSPQPPPPKRKPAITAAKRPRIILPKVDQPTADFCSSPDLAGTSYASGRSARSRRLP